MAEQIDPKELLMQDVSEQNKTAEVDHDKLPENTLTLILKVNGKVYAQGAALGEVPDDMPDEDLDSTLRAIHGLSQTAQRTLINVAGKPEGYPTQTATVEENLAPGEA